MIALLTVICCLLAWDKWISLEEISIKNGLKFEWSSDEERGKISKAETQILFMLDSKYVLLNDSRLIWLSQPVSLTEGKVVISVDDVNLLLTQFSKPAELSELSNEPSQTGQTLKSVPTTVLTVPAAPIVPIVPTIPTVPTDKTSASTDSTLTESELSKPKLFILKRIVIDPGHGGHDYGAINKWGGREKDANLAVATKLAKLISSRTNIEAVITRDRDVFVPLPERARIANQYKADETLFISIHCNSVRRGSSARGVETYVFDLSASDSAAAALAIRENAGEKVDHLSYILNDLRHRASERYSLEVARQVQRSIVSKLNLEDRNLKRAPFYVLSKTNMPAILVELGFISNKTEQRMLLNEAYQQQFAEAILQAIMELEKMIAYVN